MADAPDIDFVNGDFWGADPHAGLEWLRENDPVHFNERAGVWGITKYADLKAISKQPETFSNAGGIRPDQPAVPMMIDMDDPAHWARRKLVNKGFTPRRVREMEPKIDSVVDKLIDRVAEQGECDFVADIAAWLPLIMIGDAIGFDEADFPTLLQWSDDLMCSLGSDDPSLLQKQAEAAVGYITYIQRVVEDRRAHARDDLMSILVHAEVDGDRLDDSALEFESLLLLIGGDETTRHVITGGMYQLLLDRSRWEELRADRSLLPGAVEEMLRWVSPIKNMARIATHDVEVGGKTITEGTKVLLLYPSANMDAEQFDDPFTFDMRRSPNDHVAFGFGTHFCLGNSLARLELTGAFNRLLDRLPDLELVDTAEPPKRPANFVSGYESMPVRFTPVAPLG